MSGDKKNMVLPIRNGELVPFIDVQSYNLPITDIEAQEIKSHLLSLDPNLFLSEKPKGQMSADMWEKYMIGNASLPTAL